MAQTVAQFVNFEAGTLASLGAGNLAKHKRGATRDEHTAEGPCAGIPPVYLVDEVKGTRRALEAIDRDTRARVGRRGRKPSGVYDVLFTGPPRYDGENGTPLSEKDELAWAHACVEWVTKRAPDVIIANAVLHRDEGSPHVHLTLVPLEGVALDWKGVRARLAGREPRGKIKVKDLEASERQALFSADRKAMTGDMRAILTSFHETVSAKYGIERQKGGAGRRRRAVDRRITAELEAQAAEAAAARAVEKQRQAEERARVAKAGKEEADAELENVRETRKQEKTAATKAAEADRRAELAREEEARGRLERIETAIAVASAGRLGKKGRTGQALLDAKDRELVEVRDELGQRVTNLEAENARLAPVAASAQKVKERGDRLQRQVLEHPAALAAAEDQGFGAGVRSAIGRYGAVVGGRTAHLLADVAGWIRSGADDWTLAWSQAAREQTRDGGQGLG